MSSRAESNAGYVFASSRPTRSKALEMAFPHSLRAKVEPISKGGIQQFNVELIGLTFAEVEAIAALCREKGM